MTLIGRDFDVAAFGTWVEPAQVRQEGRDLRERVPREVHTHFEPAADRPGVVEIVEQSNAGRIPELIPLRVGRMMASPFGFYRGTAGLMAADLSTTPSTGVTAQLCGDTHASNFGLYGSAERRVVLDINDFDETVPGPWEWDLKRLAASLVLAGRESGAGEEACHTAARDSVRLYRKTMAHLAGMPVLDAWHALNDESLIATTEAHALTDTIERASAKARANTSLKIAARYTQRVHVDRWCFVEEPPLLTHVDDATAQAVVKGLEEYVETLPVERRPLIRRFAVSDVAFRIVGTGSVGLRSYVVLMHGNGEDPLILQVKEACPSALAPYVGAPHVDHDGQRIVVGQKWMQTSSDPLLGWTTIAGRSFMVRQFRNMKGSIDPLELDADQLDDYARLLGALLARAHSHSVDPRLLVGYCGKGGRLDRAISAFAVRYADQAEADHAALVAAVRSGRLEAETGV